MNGMQMGSAQPADVVGTIVVTVGTLATLLAFVLAFRATVWPGEEASDHPKNSILRADR